MYPLERMMIVQYPFSKLILPMDLMKFSDCVQDKSQ